MVKYIAFMLAGIAAALLVTIYVFPSGHNEKEVKIPIAGESPRETISALIKGLRSPDQKARAIFQSNLIEETGMFFGFKPSGFPEVREAAVREWEEWWSNNADKTKENWLANSLAMPGYKGKPLALKQLVEMKSKSAEPAIAELLSDPDSSLRAQAADALGTMEASQSAKKIIALLKKDDEMEVKRAAARALGRIHTDEALCALEDTASVDDDLTRIEAASALAMHAPDKALAVLQSLLENGHKDSKEFAVNILKNIKLVDSIPLLAGLLNSDETIAGRAHEALKEIAGEDLGREPEAWIEWHENNAKNDD